MAKTADIAAARIKREDAAKRPCREMVLEAFDKLVASEKLAQFNQKQEVREKARRSL